MPVEAVEAETLVLAVLVVQEVVVLLEQEITHLVHLQIS
jgi:hypothetical protein